MLILFLIILSIWFNHIWLISNESFILSIFLISFFLIIYIFLSFTIKSMFFSKVGNILVLLNYSNAVNLYLDKIIYYNISVKNNLVKILLKNKEKQIDILNNINKKINNFLFFSIFNFFLILKKNLFKLIKNKKLFINNKLSWKCNIIL